MESKAYEYMDWPRIEAIVYGEEASPKDVMAPRLTTDGVLVQGFFPEADKAEVLVGSRKYEMEKEDEAGYFAAMIPGRKIPEYEYRVTRGEEVQEFSDPYAFAGQITEAEEKAFCAGVYYHAYEKLGAHPMEINGVKGTSGEQRLSNFLMWQLAYTEFYFTDVPWPDFHKKELIEAIEKYNARDRRYGGVKEE